MSNSRKTDFLISKLTDETYRILPTSDLSNKTNNLLSYFNKRANNYSNNVIDPVLQYFIVKNNLLTISLEYISQTSCFRFNLGPKIFDIPRSWSFFNKYYQTIEDQQNCFFHVDEKNDDNLFLEIFHNFFDFPFNLIFLNNKGAIFILVTKKDDIDTISWLQNYFQEDVFTLSETA